MKLKFIIVDDYELDCLVTKKLLIKSGFGGDIVTYSNAPALLKDIKSLEPINQNNIILLDLLMPVMSGFQFLDEFEKLSTETQNKYTIITVTTSLYKSNIEKLAFYKSVKGTLKKPFALKSLNEILVKIA